MKTLRPYQQAAHDATIEYFRNNSGNPVVVAPVGAGKSLLIAEMIRYACQTWPQTRVLVLAHNKELLVQNENELRGQWLLADTGFYCAGLGRKILTSQIIFASIQSIYSSIYKFKPFDLVLCDEAHLWSDKETGMYTQLLDGLKQKNPLVKVIGYSGSPYRADTGHLVDGKVFDDVAYEIEMQTLIDQGYLCPPITPPVNTRLSTEGVGLRNGDYIESQLQAVVNTDDNNLACVEEILNLGRDRKKWLIFTSGIEHCENVTKLLQEAGIKTAMVTGKTLKTERAALIEEYKNGDIRCMVNVAVLTTGFNNPAIDLVANMRPMRSPVLYVQTLGRGMRTAPGKENCLYLDFGGTVDELGPVDQIKIIKKESGNGAAPEKQCPKCYALCYAAARQCEECGYIFEFESGLDIENEAAKGKAVLASQIEPEIANVNFMIFSRHEKKGKPLMLRVSYGTDKGIIPQWVCLEHTGYARSMAVKWHELLCDEPCPDTVEQAMEMEHLYRRPTKIEYLPKDEKGFPRIKRFMFDERKQEEKIEIPW